MTLNNLKKTSHIHVTRREDGSSDLRIAALILNRPDDGSPLVKGLDLNLKPGDRLIITGASGSGKSTLIRAIRELWESGEGNIELPANARIITASQRAYMPTMSLKGVLSYPRPESDFYDIQIERALRAVGHDRLVQYLPERQTHYIIDRLMDQIPYMVEKLPEPATQEWKVELLGDALCMSIPDLVAKYIDTIQPLSYENERHLRKSLIERLDDHFGHSTPRSQIEPLAKRLSDELHRSLSQKLTNHLVKDIPDLVKKYLGRVEYVDLARMRYFSETVSTRLEKGLEKSLKKSRLNPLSPFQCRDIAAQVKTAIEQELEPHLTWNFTLNKVGKWVGKLFNGAADPLRNRDWIGMHRTGAAGRLAAIFANAASADLNRVVHGVRLPLLRGSAHKASAFLTGSAAFYLAREIVNGDVLSKRLSGGEQQRLVFARALLHHPDILILDEVTAALDKDAGIALYDEIIKKLPQTIIISVAHNTHVMQHHTLHGNLEDRQIKINLLKPKEP